MKTINEIENELNITENSTYAEILNLLTLVTVDEINNIKTISVKPLPNVVRDKALELKDRMINTVIDDEKGSVAILNKRIVLLRSLIQIVKETLDENNTNDTTQNNLLTNHENRLIAIEAITNRLSEAVNNHNNDVLRIVALEAKDIILQAGINSINDIIGSDSTANTLKGRIKVLEDEDTANKEKIATNERNITSLNTNKLSSNDVIDDLTHNDTNKPLSAKQGKYLKTLIDGINNILRSDDTDLDSLQEVVAYIKSNKSLIEGITTSKVSVTDIVDSLNSNADNQPLSAKQGKILKDYIDQINAVLHSDDTDLDTIQELVTYIKNNSNVLESITNSKVSYSDIVDDLTHSDTNKPLSAKQGMVLKGLIDTINALLTSNDVDLDTLQEIVTYIKSNKSLIDNITTNKISVTDIIDDLVHEISNKPLSAKQGFVLKSLIDALPTSLKTYFYEKQEIDNLFESLNVPTFIPNVDDNGNISWTNNQGLPNPETKNIRGPRGYDFQYNWDGTKLGVKDSSQGSYAYVDLKGDTGEQGEQGEKGDTGDPVKIEVNGTEYQQSNGKITLPDLQSKIDNTHKLSSDLVDDTNQSNKFVTATEKSNISKSLYHLGAFDSADGKTRQTGYVDLSKLNWQYQSTVGCWYAENVIPNATECVASNYTCYNDRTYADISNGELTTNNTAWGAIDTIIIKDSQSNYPKGILQYKLATSYTEDIIENQSILPLDTNMANKIRQKVVDSLNLLDCSNVVGDTPTGNISFSINSNGELVVNGTSGSNYGYYRVQRFTFNGKYSMKGSIDQDLVLFVETTGYPQDRTFTLNGTYDVRIQVAPNKTYNNVVMKPMLVEGSHTYPYSDFNQKEHITNNEATLLKQEEEKCRNLFNPNAIGKENGFYNPANGYWESNNDFNVWCFYLKAGTYTINNGNDTNSQMYLGISKVDSSCNWVSNIVNLTITNSRTFTITSDSYVGISVQKSFVGSKVMLNYGSHALPYEEWNGDIVHMKDIEPVLLWKNPSPNSAFTSVGSSNLQTLSQSRANFKFLKIMCKIYMAQGYGLYCITIDTANTYYHLSLCYGNAQGNQVNCRGMQFQSDTQFYFDNNYNGGQIDNDRLIPIRIYGTNVL